LYIKLNIYYAFLTLEQILEAKENLKNYE